MYNVAENSCNECLFFNYYSTGLKYMYYNTICIFDYFKIPKPSEIVSVDIGLYSLCTNSTNNPIRRRLCFSLDW